MNTHSPSDDANPNQPNQSPNRNPREGDEKWERPSPRPPGPPRDPWVDGSPLPDDIKAIWGQSSRGPVPKGNYYAIIKDTRPERSKNGLPCLVVVFEITHGTYIACTFEYTLWLTPKGIRRTRKCCAKFGVITHEDPRKIALKGKACMVFLDMKDRDPETEIKDFTPIQTPYIEDDDCGQQGGDHSDGE